MYPELSDLDTHALPHGWADRRGNLYDGPGKAGRVVAYVTEAGIYVTGARTASQLLLIAHWADRMGR